jgi:hypothetical protein
VAIQWNEFRFLTEKRILLSYLTLTLMAATDFAHTTGADQY